MSKLATACPNISEVCRLVRRSAIHSKYLYIFRVPIRLFSLKIKTCLVASSARWPGDCLIFVMNWLCALAGNLT